MADDQKHTYDESKVKTLSSIEHIRLLNGRIPLDRCLAGMPA